MRYVICLLVFLLLPLPVWSEIENCDSWQKLWEQCETDQDCVVVSDPCGWPTVSVHRKYEQEASRCNTIAGAALSCASWSDMGGGERLAVCTDGYCKSQPF